MVESQEAEEGYLPGFTKFSGPTKVKLMQISASGTVSSKTGQKMHMATHMLHLHLYAWPAQAETFSTHTNKDRFCSASLPDDQDEAP